jgi:hypothetical protein
MCKESNIAGHFEEIAFTRRRMGINIAFIKER